jgi:phage recombination protein Bet
MNEVVKYDAGFKYTQDQIDLIKNTIAKGATDDELSMFTMLAQKYGLDPFLKEIWFIKRAKKEKTGKKDANGYDIWDYKKLPNGEIDYTGADTLIMTSRDGYLKIAQRDDNFTGIISFPVREGDIFEIDAENYRVTHKFGLKRGAIIGAWCKVDHAKRKPVIVYADFKEYNDGKSTTWKQYPSAMIVKVAETFGLKRQFGITGLVTREEMSHIKEEEIDASIEVTPMKSEVVESEPIEPEVISTISKEQAEELTNLAVEKGTGIATILAYYEVNTFSELTTKQFEDAKDILNKPRKAKQGVA